MTRKMLSIVTIIFVLFILLPATFGQTPNCQETLVSQYPGQTSFMQWSPPPVYSNQYPLEIGSTSCEEGVSQFDQVWRGLASRSWLIDVCVYRAALNSGSFFIYVSSDSSAAGFPALDLNSAFGFSDRCKWSTGHIINLENIRGFQFNPD